MHDFVPEADARGDPKVRTGGLAYLFKLQHSKGNVAVKLFKSGDPERAARYGLIDAHVRKRSCAHLVGSSTSRGG